jgi:hypothetical protein
MERSGRRGGVKAAARPDTPPPNSTKRDNPDITRSGTGRRLRLMGFLDAKVRKATVSPNVGQRALVQSSISGVISNDKIS